MGGKINLVLQKFGKAEKMFMGIVFMGLTALVFAHIVIRWMGLRSFSWLEEVAQHCYLCFVLWGASIGVTDDSLAKVRLYESVLPKKVCRIIAKCGYIICAGVAYYLSTFAYQSAASMFQVNAKTAVLKMPVGIFYAFITICFVGMGTRFVLRIFFEPEAEKKKEG